MLLELEKRPQRSSTMALLSPLIAVALTVITAGVLLAVVGIPPLQGLKVYFVDPLTNVWSLEELTVKASPLIMIAIGLSMCFLANTWNIGAEGAIYPRRHRRRLGRPHLRAGRRLVGAAGDDRRRHPGRRGLCADPAVLKVVFKANEILTSLMLVYVAQLLIDYLVRGPWRDPMGFNFPQTATFDEAATLPLLDPGGRMHLGVLITLVIVIAAAILLSRTLKGFEIRLVGQAPRAARFAGFDDKRLILLTFAISGGSRASPVSSRSPGRSGQLLPTISPGYGFTAIIVAFLGRLNPIGILVAGLALGLSFLGGEQAQISLGVPLDLTNVVQGTLLFYVLACDTLILYRVRVRSTGGRAVRGVH